MTELIWDGKYDAKGKKVAPLRIALPFQTVETVNESAADRHRTLDMFSAGKPAEWRNRLIWGDKRHVLPSLLPEFAGKVNLIYIDPPFDTGANFSYLATIPDAPQHASTPARQHARINPLTPTDGDGGLDSDTDASTPIIGSAGLSFVKEPSVIEQKAYRDTWGKGLDSYLKWFYNTVVLLRELLADDGSLYVHLDYHVGHFAKAVLDEVFGFENFRNEVIVKRITKNLQRQFATIQSLPQGHDVILWYSKSVATRYTSIMTVNTAADLKPEGYWKDFWSNADRPTMRYELLGVKPTSGQWKWSKERAQKAVANYENFEKSGRGSVVEYWQENGREWEFLRKSKSGKVEHWIEPSETKFVDTLWTDISAYQGGSKEYATQKSEALLERVIEVASNPGDLVLDCFCGSGTTAAVAEKLGRRWITCDLGRFAIHTARKRFLAIGNVKPFVVQNLGKYERQAWQTAEFGENAAAITQAYRDFILSLYRARPITGYVWLHGVKNGRMVHVGGVDAPISVGDVAQIAAEFKRSRGTGDDAPSQNSVDVLGWDFAFELNEVSKQQAAQAGVDVRFVRIPREVLEKKAVEQGDIKFFELAALSVDMAQSGKGVTLTLKDFVIPLDDVPQEIQSAITHWEQWIDYWAVDWDNKGDTFHNQWQSYRTRKDRTLQRIINSPVGTYPAAGEYKVVIKVIDILGNDTTKTLKVTIP